MAYAASSPQVKHEDSGLNSYLDSIDPDINTTNNGFGDDAQAFYFSEFVDIIATGDYQAITDIHKQAFYTEMQFRSLG